MGASSRPINKYTGGYQLLYPSARILTVKTSMVDAACSTRKANIKRVAPALEILYSLPPDTKILLHLFSNGGSFTSILIAKEYQLHTGKLLPISAMVLDSTPGRATYEATIKAFAVGLPMNIIVRFVGILLLRFFYGLYRLVYLLGAEIDAVEQARQDLNSKSLMGIDTPRLYIYSTADEMVDWHFVEEHMAEAQSVGYVVDSEKYLASGHCGHMMKDSERYWGATERLWNTAT
jgi:hypothetical protein